MGCLASRSASRSACSRPFSDELRVGVPVHQRERLVHVRGLGLAVPDQQDVGRARRQPESRLPVGGLARVRIDSDPPPDGAQAGACRAGAPEAGACRAGLCGTPTRQRAPGQVRREPREGQGRLVGTREVTRSRASPRPQGSPLARAPRDQGASDRALFATRAFAPGASRPGRFATGSCEIPLAQSARSGHRGSPQRRRRAGPLEQARARNPVPGGHRGRFPAHAVAPTGAYLAGWRGDRPGSHTMVVPP